MVVKTRVTVELSQGWLDQQTDDPVLIDELVEALQQRFGSIVLESKEENRCSFVADCDQEHAKDVVSAAWNLLEEKLKVPKDMVEVTASQVEAEEAGAQTAATPKLQLELELDAGWVLEHREDALLPVDAFVEAFRKEFGEVTVKDTALTTCCLVFTPGEQEPAAVVNKILQIELKIEQPEAVAVYRFSEYCEPAAPEEPRQQEARETQPKEEETQPEKPPQEAKAPAGERIRQLIGAVEFKALAAELEAVAKQINKHKTHRAFAFQSYLFSIGEGCGLTTYLNLLAELVSGLKLFALTYGSYSKESMVEEIRVKPGMDGVHEALAGANGHGISKKLTCLDISEWMDQLNSREFRYLLRGINRLQESQLFVFRIPFVDEQTRQKVLASIRDAVFVREVSFPPFSQQELAQYAQGLLESTGFSMQPNAWEVFDQKLIEEKGDGRFYGINTVNKVVNELLYQKQLCNLQAQDEACELLISAEDIRPILNEHYQNRGSAMQQLQALIGIEPIQQRIQEVLAQITLAMQENGLARPCLHMRFVGNPGTGKTTVARILGQLLKEQGVLSRGEFFEYAGRDFCGRYVGETAPKTAGICRDAYGSVLFIDEAYSLYRGQQDSNDYGREALDTLIAEMENHRWDFVVIMAGYPDDMETLMQGNAGLAGRMPYVINFPNYSREALFQIFMSMVEGKFAYEPGYRQAAEAYFNRLSQELLDSKAFSNARFARNLFERSWGKAALRRQLAPDQPFTLLESDFTQASSEREFSNLLETKQKRVGFIV